jgi:small subunit ribosomal protein S17
MKVTVLKIIDNKTFKAQSTVLKKHPKYGKYIIHTKKYLVDSNGNEVSFGQVVEIINSRPISKNKKWKLKK